jgi:hypothetical protein
MGDFAFNSNVDEMTQMNFAKQVMHRKSGSVESASPVIQHQASVISAVAI